MNKLGAKFGAIAMTAVMAFTFAPGAAISSLAAEEEVPISTEVETVPVYGLYNPNSGEHLFTISESERENLLSVGWQEGDVKWKAPTAGEMVFRLYNPNVVASDGTPLGDHHYTSNEIEVESLVAAGWKEDGLAFYSSIVTSSDRVPIYGLYNPNAYAMGMSGAHHLSFNKNEVDRLLALGWQEGDPKFYGYAVPLKEDNYDVLADGRYVTAYTDVVKFPKGTGTVDIFQYNHGGVISDDLSMLTINTAWNSYDETTYAETPAYPRKEYHLPFSDNCWVDLRTEYFDLSGTLSQTVGVSLSPTLNGTPLRILVRNGEIVEITPMP